MKVAALVMDSVGLSLSVLAKVSAVKTGNQNQSAQADKSIKEGIKRIKRDISS